MAGVRGMPPGRAGRIWLTRRLAVAQGAADLLDQKVRVLRQEAERFALLCDRSGAEWTRAAQEAQEWSLRAALVGGQAALRAATDGDQARLSVAWETTMGVGHPAGVEWEHVAAPHVDGVTYGPATMAAAHAHRVALEAAVRHAVDQAALRAVSQELAVTRRRLRAVTDRWVPRLADALARTRLDLEETERAEGVRLRWAVAAHARSEGRS